MAIHTKTNGRVEPHCVHEPHGADGGERHRQHHDQRLGQPLEVQVQDHEDHQQGHEAVAEHAVAMLLTLNRKTHKAYNRVREQNFSLDGLLGFNLHGKTIGVVGTGNIGKAFWASQLNS